MRLIVLESEVVYDGTQLSTPFVDEHAPGGEDVGLFFCGPADVPRENLVDLEDAEAGAFIYSPFMAHVLLEHRGIELVEAVWRQRVLVHLAGRWIEGRCGARVEVRGDDLFVHFSNIAGTGFKKLVEGQSVEFEVAQGRKGLEATNVRAL